MEPGTCGASGRRPSAETTVRREGRRPTGRTEPPCLPGPRLSTSGQTPPYLWASTSVVSSLPWRWMVTSAAVPRTEVRRRSKHYGGTPGLGAPADIRSLPREVPGDKDSLSLSWEGPKVEGTHTALSRPAPTRMWTWSRPRRPTKARPTKARVRRGSRRSWRT